MLKTIMIFIFPFFLFANNIELMDNIIKNDFEFKKTTELVKYKPKKMTNEMKKLYISYQNGDNEAGVTLAKLLYKDKKYIDAGEILTEIISSNTASPEAFTLLGDLFIHGRGVEKNCLKGGMFYMGGVSAGDCRAYHKMYLQYKEGYCVDKNNKKAKKFLLLEKKCNKDKELGIIKAKKVDNKMVIFGN